MGYESWVCVVGNDDSANALGPTVGVECEVCDLVSVLSFQLPHGARQSHATRKSSQTTLAVMSTPFPQSYSRPRPRLARPEPRPLVAVAEDRRSSGNKKPGVRPIAICPGNSISSVKSGRTQTTSSHFAGRPGCITGRPTAVSCPKACPRCCRLPPISSVSHASNKRSSTPCTRSHPLNRTSKDKSCNALLVARLRSMYTWT